MYRCRDREYTVLYDVTGTRIDRFFQSLTIIHLILVELYFKLIWNPVYSPC